MGLIHPKISLFMASRFHIDKKKKAQIKQWNNQEQKLIYKTEYNHKKINDVPNKRRQYTKNL